MRVDRWLQDVARKLDPPPRPPTRQGRWRQRQRNGCAIYRLELHVEPIIDALIRSQRLGEADALQHAKVEQALAILVEDWAGQDWPER
jgi:hypothetical protein